MNAILKKTGGQGCRRWSLGLAALVLVWGGGAFAQGVVAVPSAHLHHAEGSVAWAPQGDKEWHDVQPRRLLKRGDRLWTDRGSRAEVQAGGHALRLNGETQLVLENVAGTATQLSLTQGSVVATVTRLDAGDSFEIGTPNLAFRARQAGDYRIDVDTRQGVTRIVVLAGAGVAYGENGEVTEVRNGQRATFKERSLARVQQPAFAATDDFDRWAGARRRGEPTVSMPNVAAGPAPAKPTPEPAGRTIVISGAPSSLARPAAATAQNVPALAAALPQAAPGAKPIPTAPGAAAAMRVTATAPQPAPVAPIAPSAQQRAEEERRAASARVEEERRAAAARAEEERRAAANRAEGEKRAAAAAEARRAEERRRAAAAKKAEEERRQAQARRAEDERRAQQAAKREQDQKRGAAARRAEEEKRALQAKRAAEEKRLAAARKAAESQKLAEARRRQLARLQEQAHREEQSVQARREQQARRAEEERREELARREDQYRREEQARREEQWRREEQIRREEEARRQRILIEQARRDQERREQEVWLRQQQHQYQQPLRPPPMGVPARRVS